MNGYADFKSHVLKREEKGLFGVPFKRLLLAGCGGGMMTVLSRIPFPDWSLIFGIVTALTVILLTSPRGGIPRWQHILYIWRWRLLVAGATAPTSILGGFGQLLQLPTSRLDIDGNTLFTPSEVAAPRTQMTDWVSFAQLPQADTEEGLIFIETSDLLLLPSEAA